MFSIVNNKCTAERQNAQGEKEILDSSNLCRKDPHLVNFKDVYFNHWAKEDLSDAVVDIIWESYAVRKD